MRACGVRGITTLPPPHSPASATPKGVQSYDVSLEKQTVTVRGDVTPEAVLETVKKTGKKTELVK